jgi:hypothetical protein
MRMFAAGAACCGTCVTLVVSRTVSALSIRVEQSGPSFVVWKASGIGRTPSAAKVAFAPAATQTLLSVRSARRCSSDGLLRRFVVNKLSLYREKVEYVYMVHHRQHPRHGGRPPRLLRCRRRRRAEQEGKFVRKQTADKLTYETDALPCAPHAIEPRDSAIARKRLMRPHVRPWAPSCATQPGGAWN